MYTATIHSSSNLSTGSIGIPKMSDSISNLARKEEDSEKYIQDMPIYSHWLGIELQKVLDVAKEQVSSKKGSLRFELVCSENAFEIDRVCLDNASSRLEKACNLTEKQSNFGLYSHHLLCKSELSLSALISIYLHEFLFHKTRNGLCLHQCPVRKRQDANPEAADIYVCSSVNGEAGTPVLVADVKNTEFETAYRESALYGCGCVEVHSFTGKRVCPVMLGLPCTKTEAKLQLYVEGLEKLWCLPISGKSQLHSKPLLCALYCGVQFIIQKSFNIRNRMAYAKPLYGADLSPLKEGFNCRVFLNEANGLVYKYYSNVGQPDEEPNIEHFKGEVVQLSSDVKLLTYQYVEGSMNPNSLPQFSGALRDLNVLHKSELVHGDVRLENIIFFDDTSKLIDYDLVSKEGNRYPGSYNSGIKCRNVACRHPNALPNQPMYKLHDIHSLLVIIITCLDEDKQPQIYQNLWDLLKKGEFSASCVAVVLGIELS